MTRLQSPLLLAAALAALVTACSKAAPAPRRAPNVVLICLDTVRADHLGTYGYARPTTPALDALAERSVVFTQARATAGWTKPSVPSFLTSTYPLQHGVYEGSAHDPTGTLTDLLPSQAFTLAEAFQAGGYRTGAFLHNAQLRRGNGFEQGFEHYEEDKLDARRIRWLGLDWIDDGHAAAKGQPFFLYLHFLDAHWPYPAGEEWFTRFATAAATERFRGADSRSLYDAINDGAEALSEADRTALEALYDGALSYLDSELGRFFEGLTMRGLDQDTIVCVIADHGEEFGEHGRLGHGHGLWENLLHVPWILAVPGTPSRRHVALVSLVDVMPTLLAAAGLPAPPGMQGVDRLHETDLERPILAEHKTPDRYLQALRVGPEKLLRTFEAPPDAELAEYILPVPLGTRWEAELEVVDGEFIATQLKPRDEGPTEPPELKGRLNALTTSGFQIAGVSVRYDQASERQTGPGTAGPDLAPELVVKVRGVITDGVLQADRIRFYPPDESEQPELRATVETLEQSGGHGFLTMAGIKLRITPETQLKGVASAPKKRRLTREQITEILTGGSLPFAETNRFTLQRSLYDLTRDPGELAALAAPPGSPLDARLEELGAELVPLRLFATGDQKVVDPATLMDLQALGYGGGR